MKTTFLFGAGADSIYNICKGISFVEPLLLGQFEKERKALLDNSKGNYQLLYPKSKKIYLQTIASHRDEAANVFGEDFTTKCIQYYNKECNDSKIQGEIEECINKWYYMIKEKAFGSDYCTENAYQFFLSKAVFFDSLDEKMNDLRNAKLNTNGKRIINAYATIFIMMMREMYDLEKFTWNFNEVFSILREGNKKINYDIKSYYQILKELMPINHEPEEHEVFFATTNYTDIAEKVLGRNITYLHGRLNWFEDYQHLMVYDCLDDAEYQEALKHTKTLVPFIMIPSGIKPIICKKQIEEFHKFIDNLDNSDVLCVLGYKFNSEDNHINSIIAEWLRISHKKLLYFNYGQEFNFSKARWAECFAETITTKDWNDFSKSANVVHDFLHSPNKIMNIVIGEHDSNIDFQIFERAVKTLLD